MVVDEVGAAKDKLWCIVLWIMRISAKCSLVSTSRVHVDPNARRNVGSDIQGQLSGLPEKM